MGCGASRLRAGLGIHSKHSQLPGDLPDWSPRLLQHQQGGGRMRRNGGSCWLLRVLGTGATLCSRRLCAGSLTSP